MIILPDRELVVIDIETTDHSLAMQASTFPEPIEIACIRLNLAYETLGEFSTIIQPSDLGLFTEFSSGLTGLSTDILATAPRFPEIAGDLVKFVGKSKLLAWGAVFDHAVLWMAYARANLAYPHKYPFFDLLSFAYLLSAEYGFIVKNWRLSTVCERFSIEKEDSKHRALSGARKAVEVLQALARLDEEV